MAMMIMIAAATAANTAGRLLIASVHRTHAGDSTRVDRLPSFSARRSRRRGIQRPRIASSAGSSVSAAMTVKATVTAAAMATPWRKLTPRANMPSIAMHTISPANSTARPLVSIASTTAASRDSPRITACL